MPDLVTARGGSHRTHRQGKTDPDRKYCRGRGEKDIFTGFYYIAVPQNQAVEVAAVYPTVVETSTSEGFAGAEVVFAV